MDLLSSYEEIPIIAAFILGLVGALAPCQITGNISAIAYYGNKSLASQSTTTNIIFFVLGKVFVFSALGILIWVAGTEIKSQLTPFFSWSRKFIGLFIVLLGVFTAGWIHLNKLPYSSKLPLIKNNKFGSFLLGSSFSIAFCPTMFILFFGALMPIVLSYEFGFILPFLFGVGTSLPFILIVYLISTFSDKGKILKKSRRIGKIAQVTLGILLIVIGIIDTITYWSF